MSYVSKEEIDFQKQLIGDFFIQFDSAISFIPQIIPRIIFPINLDYQKGRNIENLLAGMTADVLKSKLDSLVVDNYPKETKLFELNSKLSNKVSEIIEIRNSLAHGSYRLGWINLKGDYHKDTFSLRHSKSTKKNGYEKRSKIHHIEELQQLIQQLHIINNSYSKICSIIMLINDGRDDGSRLIKQLEEDLKNIGKIKFSHLEILN